MSVEEPDFSLRNELLQLFVGPHRQIHMVGVGADQHELVSENQIDRKRKPFKLFLFRHWT